jgi:hypothetical protein
MVNSGTFNYLVGRFDPTFASLQACLQHVLRRRERLSVSDTQQSRRNLAYQNDCMVYWRYVV